MGYKIIEIEPEKMECIKEQVEEMLMIGGRLMSVLEECCDEPEEAVGMRRGMRRGGMMGRRHGGVYSGNDLTSPRKYARSGRDWDDEY